MTLYQKEADEWVAAEKAYVKVNGVWVSAKEGYVKRTGVWTSAYHFDNIAPPAPVLSLAIIDKITRGTVTGNYIRVGIRVVGSNNIAQVRRVRVLTTYENAYPTTQYGGTYTGGTDSNYPTEPWSEWRYNSFGPHNDTSLLSYKQWPRNAEGNNWYLTAGRKYHFKAWTEDFDGNWSLPTDGVVTGPKRGVNSANVYTKQARFLPVTSGSLGVGDVFTAGQAIQRNTPRSNGIYFYGNQIVEAVGQQGTPTIKTAQILVCRMDDDGPPTANVYLYRHAFATQASLTVPATKSEITKIGTINKGETKWMAIPAAHRNNINTTGRGFGFYFKDPAKAAAFADDYSVLKGLSESTRAGEVSLTWTEAL